MSTQNTTSADRPEFVGAITRSHMRLNLPRLDDKCLDSEGNTDPVAKKRLEENIARFAYVYDVGGRIMSTKAAQGKGDDPSTRFAGEFKAHVAPQLGGKWYASSRCYLPRFFEEQLYATFVQAREKDPNAILEFLVRIGIKPPKGDKPSITGYEWTVETLVSFGVPENAVDALFARAEAGLALPAPTPPAAGEVGAGSTMGGDDSKATQASNRSSTHGRANHRASG